MREYRKRLDEVYNHRCPMTMLDYLKIKAENEYLNKMISSACQEYESLIDDIINCREIKIDSNRFFVPEKINEE